MATDKYTTQIVVRVTNEMKENLDKILEKKPETVTWLLRNYLSEYIEKNKGYLK